MRRRKEIMVCGRIYTSKDIIEATGLSVRGGLARMSLFRKGKLTAENLLRPVRGYKTLTTKIDVAQLLAKSKGCYSTGEWGALSNAPRNKNLSKIKVGSLEEKSNP